ncbi:MAG: malonyl-CoA synthase [Burkholderiales bacterium]|nr:malonyl-CoA synthase [Burkholderiales bacterium]
MTDNLYDLIAARMPADRSACALETHDGQYWRWRDLEQASARIANLLASLQLPAQSRIAVQVDKSPEALCLYLATLRAGHVFLPLNTAYQKGEIAYFIEDAEPAVVVCMPSCLADVSAIAAGLGSVNVFTLSDDGSGSLIDAAAPHADEFSTVACESSSLAAVLYTSGTTGRSKGAMLSHGNLASNALTLHSVWRWRQDDVLLHALPIFHVHGLFVAIHGALLSGSKMIWLPLFDAKEVVRHLPGASVFMGVPTMYVRLLDEPAFDNTAAAGMRLFISGSAPLLAETFRQFETRTGQRILERYGMSETVMLTSNPYEGHRAAGTVGLPLPDVSVRVVDDAGKPCACDEVGGVEVRGPNVFGGYWRMPEKTREEFTADGWFKTGDVGRFDAQGYLTIVGRSKDLIISGGYNVYPKEVESYLDDMPGVAESAVIGVPDRDFGEAVTAVVVAQAGAQLDGASMISTLKSLIASYKVPKRIHIVDELPRNAMGKVQKNELRKQYST